MSLPSGLAAQFGMAEEVYTNEVQTISGTPSGTFGLNFDGALTVTTLATNASAASIQNVLNALPNIGSGGVSCSGGPLPSAVSITFSGPLVAGRNVPLLAVQGGVTGLTFGTTTPGTGYGDIVTPDHFSEFLQEQLAADIPRITGQGLRAGNTTQRSDRTFSNKKGGGGTVDFEVADRGFGLHWKYALGASQITTPGGGTNVRDHTYTIDPNGQISKSLTIQKGVPDVTGTVRAFTGKGAKVTAWQLTQAVDDWLKLQLTYDLLDVDTATALAAASYPSSQAIFHYDQCQATIAGANVDIRNLQLGGNRNLNTARYFIRPSTLKKEPLPNGFYDVTGSCDADFSDMAAYNRFVAGNLVPITFTWVGAVMAAPDAAFNFQLSVTMPNCRFDGDTPQVGGPDLVGYTLPFVALNDGVSQPITVVARNQDTTD